MSLRHVIHVQTLTKAYVLQPANINIVADVKQSLIRQLDRPTDFSQIILKDGNGNMCQDNQPVDTSKRNIFLYF